ncbi:MAG: DUF4145 domain-containing protein [Sphingobium sp.]
MDKVNFLFYQQWPKIDKALCPPDTPENVVNYFDQATDSLNSGNFDAAGIMFRKALESATKGLDSELSRINLVKRIEKLVENNLITPALGEWATEIRLGGNDAAHEDEPFSKEEAQALHDFCENFLRYAFTLPAAVTRRATVGCYTTSR